MSSTSSSALPGTGRPSIAARQRREIPRDHRAEWPDVFFIGKTESAGNESNRLRHESIGDGFRFGRRIGKQIGVWRANRSRCRKRRPC